MESGLCTNPNKQGSASQIWTVQEFGRVRGRQWEGGGEGGKGWGKAGKAGLVVGLARGGGEARIQNISWIPNLVAGGLGSFQAA